MRQLRKPEGLQKGAVHPRGAVDDGFPPQYQRKIRP